MENMPENEFKKPKKGNL